jgi:hypothetical protein
MIVFAIGANQFDARLVVRVFAQKVIRKQFEPDSLSTGHFVFGLKLHPLTTGADAVFFALVGAHGAAWRVLSDG